MSQNECCSEELDETCECDCNSGCNCDCDCNQGVSVKVNVDVPKIVKYVGLTAVLIVGVIFGTKCFRDMLKEGFFNELD